MSAGRQCSPNRNSGPRPVTVPMRFASFRLSSPRYHRFVWEMHSLWYRAVLPWECGQALQTSAEPRRHNCYSRCVRGEPVSSKRKRRCCVRCSFQAQAVGHRLFLRLRRRNHLDIHVFSWGSSETLVAIIRTSWDILMPARQRFVLLDIHCLLHVMPVDTESTNGEYR